MGRTTGNRAKFVGGMRYAATGGVLSGGTNFSWPLAILELRDDAVVISPRILRKQFPPVEMPLATIGTVESRFGISGGGIRFRVDGPGEGTVFWSVRKKKKQLVLDALRAAGLRVA